MPKQLGRSRSIKKCALSPPIISVIQELNGRKRKVAESSHTSISKKSKQNVRYTIPGSRKEDKKCIKVKSTTSAVPKIAQKTSIKNLILVEDKPLQSQELQSIKRIRNWKPPFRIQPENGQLVDNIKKPTGSKQGHSQETILFKSPLLNENATVLTNNSLTEKENCQSSCKKPNANGARYEDPDKTKPEIHVEPVKDSSAVDTALLLETEAAASLSNQTFLVQVNSHTATSENIYNTLKRRHLRDNADCVLPRISTGISQQDSFANKEIAGEKREPAIQETNLFEEKGKSDIQMPQSVSKQLENNDINSSERITPPTVLSTLKNNLTLHPVTTRHANGTEETTDNNNIIINDNVECNTISKTDQYNSDEDLFESPSTQTSEKCTPPNASILQVSTPQTVKRVQNKSHNFDTDSDKQKCKQEILHCNSQANNNLGIPPKPDVGVHTITCPDLNDPTTNGTHHELHCSNDATVEGVQCNIKDDGCKRCDSQVPVLMNTKESSPLKDVPVSCKDLNLSTELEESKDEKTSHAVSNFTSNLVLPAEILITCEEQVGLHSNDQENFKLNGIAAESSTQRLPVSYTKNTEQSFVLENRSQDNMPMPTYMSKAENSAITIDKKLTLSKETLSSGSGLDVTFTTHVHGHCIVNNVEKISAVSTESRAMKTPEEQNTVTMKDHSEDNSSPNIPTTPMIYSTRNLLSVLTTNLKQSPNVNLIQSQHSQNTFQTIANFNSPEKLLQDETTLALNESFENHPEHLQMLNTNITHTGTLAASQCNINEQFENDIKVSSNSCTENKKTPNLTSQNSQRQPNGSLEQSEKAALPNTIPFYVEILNTNQTNNLELESNDMDIEKPIDIRVTSPRNSDQGCTATNDNNVSSDPYMCEMDQDLDLISYSQLLAIEDELKQEMVQETTHKQINHSKQSVTTNAPDKNTNKYPQNITNSVFHVPIMPPLQSFNCSQKVQADRLKLRSVVQELSKLNAMITKVRQEMCPRGRLDDHSKDKRRSHLMQTIPSSKSAAQMGGSTWWQGNQF